MWPDRVALGVRDRKSRVEISFGELGELVERFARGVVALGIRPGDRVLCIADGSPRWIVTDLGLMRAGAVTVHRGADTTPDEVSYLAEHSEAAALLCGSPRVLSRMADSAGEVGSRILITGESEGAASFEDVLAAGDREGADPPEPGGPDRLATIVYTSGTTGRPKGVMLTHGNILHNMRVLPEVIHIEDEERFLCILPSWHMLERTVEYTALLCGSTLVFSSLRTLKRDLREERPTYLVAVPRLWEGIQAGFEGKLAERGRFARALARFLRARAESFAAARRRVRGELHEEGRATGPRNLLGGRLGMCLAAPLGLLGKKLLGGTVREALGGKLKVGVSGGGRLPFHLDLFLDAMGITVLVGYGLTETSPVAAIRTVERNVLGTIGRAIPETELRIAGEGENHLPSGTTGELWVRGPQVMQGYYRDPGASSAVMPPKGWFRTGDLCSLTEEGDLVFRGRIKSTIVLAGGENIEPGPIESRILESPLVRQAVVLGQDRKTLAALLVPHRDVAEKEAARRGASVSDVLKAEVTRLVTRDAGFHARELVPRVAVLEEEFTISDGTLTPTQKLKRNVIHDRYAELIEGLYAD